MTPQWSSQRRKQRALPPRRSAQCCAERGRTHTLLCCCAAACRAAVLQHAVLRCNMPHDLPSEAARGPTGSDEAQQCGSHHGGVPLPRVQPRERGRCTTRKPGRHLAVGLAWRRHVRSLRSAVDAEELHHGTGPLASDGACARLYRPRCTTRLRATDRTNEGSQQPQHREGPTLWGPLCHGYVNGK